MKRPAGVVNIGDVAKAAGVSPATVSRVLNGTTIVSADRTERVLQAATDLGYQPFGPARALRQQVTRVWAAIIADIENPFFTSMVRGIEDVARAEGYRLVLCNSDEDLDREQAYIDVAVRERMAGVVIAASSAEDSTFEALIARGTPVVAVDRLPDRHRNDLDSVVVDNHGGALEATNYLINGGARRVACITGPSRATTASERLAGYRAALREHGRKTKAALIRRADYKEVGGYKAMQALLAVPQVVRPDGLFVANNLMTLGALRAIAEAGLRVPDDIALVSFDEAPWTTIIDPPLTVVAQPTYEIGRQAAHLLVTAGGREGARQLVLQPRLVVRGSTHPVV